MTALSSLAFDNRRSRLRLRTQMDCWYRVSGYQTFSKTRLCDLSETGAGMYAADVVGEGKPVDLTLRLGEGRYFSLSARTVWQRPCASGALMGLEFVHEKPAAVRKWLAGQRALKIKEMGSANTSW